MSRKITPYLFTGFLFLNPLIYLGTSETPKFIFLLIVSEVLILLYFLSLKTNKFNSINKIALIYLLVVFIADILGLDPRISLLGTQIRHQGFLLTLSCVFIFIAAGQSFSQNYLNKFRLAIISSSIVLSTIAIFEFILLYFLKLNIPNYGGRIVATIGNPDFLGGYFAATLPFLLWSKFKFKYKLIIIAPILFTILITFSRSAIIASVLIIFVYIYKSFGMRKTIYTGIVALLFLFVFIFSNNTFSQQLKRFSIWDSRTILWSEGIKAVAKRPILGYGQENFELVFPKSKHIIVDNSHNIFLETILSSGVLALILFVLIVYLSMKKASLEVKLSLGGLLFLAFFNPLSVAEIALFWFLMGLGKL